MGKVTKENERWIFGWCWRYAVALNRFTGWPIRFVNGLSRTVLTEYVHCVVEMPDGRLFDASGIVTIEELEKRYLLKGIYLTIPEPRHYHEYDMASQMDAEQAVDRQLRSIRHHEEQTSSGHRGASA